MKYSRNLGLIFIQCAILLVCCAGYSYAQLISPLPHYSGQEVLNIQWHKQWLMEFRALRLLNDLQLPLHKHATASEDFSEFEKALAYTHSGSYVLAERLCQNFISSRPNSPLIPFFKFLRGIIAYHVLDYTKSSQFFSEAAYSMKASRLMLSDSIQSLPSDNIHNDKELLQQLSLYWAGISFTQQGLYEEAISSFNDAIQLSPRGVFADDALFALGQVAEVRNDLDSAIVYYNRLTNQYAQSSLRIIGHIRHAQMYIYKRDAKSATFQLERATSILESTINPDSIPMSNGNNRMSTFSPSPQVFSSGGGIHSVYVSQTNYEQPEALYIPNGVSVQILFLRGQTQLLLGQYPAAVTLFEKVINDTNTMYLKQQARIGAGMAYLQMNQPKKALVYYNAIVDSSEYESSTIRAIAQLYRAVSIKNDGDQQTALKEFSALISQSDYPYTGQVLLELGQMSYQDGKLDQARRFLERGEREAQDAVVIARTQLLLGATYSEQKQWSKAIRTFQNAEITALKSTNQEMPERSLYMQQARLRRGVCMAQNGQYREAMTDLNTFLADNENHRNADEAQFWLTECYYRSDLMQNSEEGYKRVLAQYPTSKRREESLYGLGWTLFRTKQFEATTKVFTQLLDEFPKSVYRPDVYLRRGDALFVTREYIDAAKSYREVVKLTPRTEEGQYAQFQMGQALYRADDYTAAVQALRVFAKAFPLSAIADDALYTIAWMKFQQRSYDDAVTEFTNLISTYPQSELIPQSRYYIGNCSFNKEEYEKAITLYKQIIKDYPNNYYAGQAVKSIQDALINLGRDDEAYTIAKEYVDQNPNSSVSEDVKLQSGQLFYSGKNYKNAIVEYQDFIKKYPDSERAAEALYWLAKSQSNLADKQPAEETYRLLLQKYPTSDFSRQALLELATVRLAAVDLQGADSLFSVVQKRYPKTDEDARAGFERAQIARVKNDSTKMLEQYLASVNATNGEYSAQSRYQIAMLYRSKNKHDSARSYFQPLVANDNNPALAAESQYRIGELYMRDKTWDLAIISFKVVKEKFTNEEDWFTLSLINLGECYEKINDAVAAREIYQTVIILHPNDDYGKTAQSRLKRVGK